MWYQAFPPYNWVGKQGWGKEDLRWTFPIKTKYLGSFGIYHYYFANFSSSFCADIQQTRTSFWQDHLDSLPLQLHDIMTKELMSCDFPPSTAFWGRVLRVPRGWTGEATTFDWSSKTRCALRCHWCQQHLPLPISFSLLKKQYFKRCSCFSICCMGDPYSCQSKFK